MSGLPAYPGWLVASTTTAAVTVDKADAGEIVCCPPSPMLIGTHPRLTATDVPSAALNTWGTVLSVVIARGMKSDGHFVNPSCTEYPQFESVASVRPVRAGLEATM